MRRVAPLGAGRFRYRRYLPATQAAKIKITVNTTEKTIGGKKKYFQLKTVTTTKQAASPQGINGITSSVSLLNPPSCQANTAANSRNAVTKYPNPR